MPQVIGLFVLGGFLAGAAWAARPKPVIAVILALCSVLAVVSAVLRYG